MLRSPNATDQDTADTHSATPLSTPRTTQHGPRRPRQYLPPGRRVRAGHDTPGERSVGAPVHATRGASNRCGHPRDDEGLENGQGVAKGAVRAAGIHDLPVESLAHVFAHLPPSSMLVCTAVCKIWNEVVQDESSWRNAFFTYFGLSRGEGAAAEHLGRRLEPTSWRTEYIARIKGLSAWDKSRTGATTHDPRLGLIHSMHVDFSLFDPSLLSVSQVNGLAVRSNPWTGKLVRSGLFEADPANALGLGHLGNAAGEVECTAVGISPDGIRIAWGMRNGEVRVSVLAKAAGPPRALSSLGDVLHRHRSAVSAVGWSPHPLAAAVSRHLVPAPPPGLPIGVATASLDGVVKLWDVANSTIQDASFGVCLWTAGETMHTASGAADPGVAIALDTGRGRHQIASLAVGTAAGYVHIWTNLDLNNLANSGTGNQSVMKQRYRCIPPAHNDGSAIDHLYIDAGSPISVLVHAKGEAWFRRVWPWGIDPSDPSDARTTVYGHTDGMLSTITALRPDFDVQSPAKAAALPTDHAAAGGRSSGGCIESGANSPIAPQPFGQSQYVIAGDAQGRVYVWNWSRELERTTDVVKPVMRLQGFDCKVTALELSPLLVFVGSVNGTIRAYDLLSGSLVRMFTALTAGRHPTTVLAAGHAAPEEEERYAARNIRATRDGVVASVGTKILSWRPAPEPKRKEKPKANGRAATRADAPSSWQGLRRELEELRSDIAYENAERQAGASRMRRANQLAVMQASVMGMTEDEAIQYAMMLSAEEAGRDLEEDAARLGLQNGETATSSSRTDQSSRSSAGLNFGEEPEAQSLSPPSPFGSPSGGPSSRSPGAAGRRPPSALASSLTLHAKVQATPRPSPTSAATHLPTASGGPPPDMSASAWPVPSSAAAAGRARDGSRPREAGRTPPGAGRAAGATGQGLGSVSPPLTGSPGAGRGARPSLLTVRLREEEDLRFAIELSLAEERSRLESEQRPEGAE